MNQRKFSGCAQQYSVEIIRYLTFSKTVKNRKVMHPLQNWAWLTDSSHHNISISLYLNNATKSSQCAPKCFCFDCDVSAVIFEVSFRLLCLTQTPFMLMPPNLDGHWINLLSMYAKFHSKILVRGWNTIQQVRELQYYAFDMIFLLSNIIF